VASGVVRFDLKRGESHGMRFLRFRAWIREVLAHGDFAPHGRPVGVVAYEQAHHRGGAATSLCVGLVTEVLAEAAAVGAETTSVHTGTLKKHATGRGGADKDAMHRAALVRWPGHQWGTGDAPTAEEVHDAADALCVLAWALDEIGEGAE
jgi:Holliday junction resolvasome RuvABC endonuclease subunit